MKKKRGTFIVFEGGEGSGKTTQANLLYQYLIDRGYKTYLTTEPGGHGGIGVFIRKLLRDPKYKDRIDDLAEFFLFQAARAQHVNKEIKLRLEQGYIVICDRFHASTYAYQIEARKVLGDKEFKFIDKIATGGLSPDFSFLVDISPETGLRRKKNEGVLTRFEQEKLIFHKKVRLGFKKFFGKHVQKNQWVEIRGSDPAEESHQKIIDILIKKQLIPGPPAETSA
jgi:dTMP kinase